MRMLLLLLATVSFNASANLQCMDTATGNSSVWTVGQKYTPLDEVGVHGGQLMCFADGKELTYIQQNFTGLRSVAAQARDWEGVIWEGDDAQFINNNL